VAAKVYTAQGVETFFDPFFFLLFAFPALVLASLRRLADLNCKPLPGRIGDRADSLSLVLIEAASDTANPAILSDESERTPLWRHF
jgi:hypothetical protein